MLLEDQANLREVIAFPLNQAARDLLMGAPSPVLDTQLAELHLRVVRRRRNEAGPQRPAQRLRQGDAGGLAS